MLEKQRALELVRERVRTEQLSADLPSIVESRVDEQMQKLEDKLISEFRELGQKAVVDSADALSEQLGSRIEMLEKVSADQSRTLMNLRDSSKVANQKVARVVDSIENSLAAAVPGFKLEPLPQREELPSYVHPQFQPESPKKAITRANTQELTETDEGGDLSAFCPACTSKNVRRTNRQGVFEELLRLFFIAPYRCRACRHKFYAF